MNYLQQSQYVSTTQKKTTPDNLQEFTIPKITQLTSEGETFVKNKLKLIDTIFTPKGWCRPLDKYATFMTNVATIEFALC